MMHDMDFITWVEILAKAVYIFHSTNTFEKSMNLAILSSAMGK